MNSNEEIFFLFSVFSSRMQPKRHEEPQKKHLRASVSKRHVKIFLTREKKKKRKRRDEFDHDTSKKVKQQEFYIQKYRKG